MSGLPVALRELHERYGQSKIVRHEYPVPVSQFGVKDEVLDGACVIVRTIEGEFVLIRHSYDLPGMDTNTWTIPGGGRKEGESFEGAAIRETLEETGLNIRITGLYQTFQFVRVSEDRRKELYVPVFYGEVVSGAQKAESPEILEVRRFRKLPRNFAGELGKYYEDLML